MIAIITVHSEKLHLCPWVVIAAAAAINVDPIWLWCKMFIVFYLPFLMQHGTSLNYVTYGGAWVRQRKINAAVVEIIRLDLLIITSGADN